MSIATIPLSPTSARNAQDNARQAVAGDDSSPRRMVPTYPFSPNKAASVKKLK